MSKEQRAPDDLELVRAFVNTADIEQGTDHLGSAETLSAWLLEHGLLDGSATAASSDLARAIALREALRAILLVHTGAARLPTAASETLDTAARRARLRLRFDGHGTTLLESEVDGIDGALGRLLIIVHDSISRGTWTRLKACRLHGCEWAFYDHTKNHSGVWCDMEVCGNRAKARAYRERRPSTKP